MIPSSRQRSFTTVSLLLIAAIARFTFAGVIVCRRPPRRPRARAAINPARVLSDISARSYSARAAKILNTSFPSGMVVSMLAPCPFSTLRDTSLAWKSSITFTKSDRFLPSRSSFQTSSVSPFLRAFKHESSPGLSSVLPDAWSI